MTEKNYFATNLKFLRQKKNMEQLELAHLLKRKSSSSVSEWEKGKYQPKSGILSDIASIFGVGLSDLMETDLTVPRSTSLTSLNAKNDTVQAINDAVVQLRPERQENVLGYATEQLDEQEKESVEIQEEIAEYNSDKIIAFPPKFNYDFYDNAGSAGTGQYLGDVRKEVIALPIDVDADFVIPVYGRSMEPEYYTGDYVFVKLSVDLKDGDIGVFDYYGDAYIKQLVIDEDGAYLHSFNPEYPDMPIDADSDFRIIGEVVEVYREN